MPIVKKVKTPRKGKPRVKAKTAPDISRIVQDNDIGGLIKALAPENDIETRSLAIASLFKLGIKDPKVGEAIQNISGDKLASGELHSIATYCSDIITFVREIGFGKTSHCDISYADLKWVSQHLNFDEHLRGFCPSCYREYSNMDLIFLINRLIGGLQKSCQSPNCPETMIRLFWESEIKKPYYMT